MQPTRTSSLTCKDILINLRGYPQQPARISSTTCKDILANQCPFFYDTKRAATLRCSSFMIKFFSLRGGVYV